MLRPCGDRYEGYFVNDKFEGRGRMTYSKNPSENKLEYKGTWKNGLRDGNGEMTWKSGASYKGEWKEGMRSG